MELTSVDSCYIETSYTHTFSVSSVICNPSCASNCKSLSYCNHCCVLYGIALIFA